MCYKKNGCIYYDGENAPALPVVFEASYYGYTPWKKKTSTSGKHINTKNGTILLKECMECNMYIAHKGDAYVTTMTQEIDSDKLNADKEYLKNINNI